MSWHSVWHNSCWGLDKKGEASTRHLKNRVHYFRSQATKVWEEDNRHAIVLIGDALVAVGNAALVLGRVDELSLSYRFIWS
jgi:hypothetical protein